MELLKEITEYLFDGMVDYREVEDAISKMGPDASEVHVNKPLTAKEKKLKRQKREINIGLANNAFGAAAGVVGTKLAYDQAKTLDPKTMKTKPEVKTSKVGLALKKMKVNPKVAALGAGSAIVGTQLVNGAMDAQSAQYFARERMKLDKKKKVSKSIEGLLQARRDGKVTTDQLIDTVSKAATDQISLDRLAAQSTKKGKGIVLVGTGMLAAGGGAYAMHKAKQKNINPKVPKVSMEPIKRVEKSADAVWEGEISKVDDEKRQVFGWCSLTKFDGEDVIDKQGDYIPLSEVEKSAYDYVIHSRKGGDMHKRDGETALHTSDMIESFVVTPEKLEKFGLEPDALPHGWWVGFKVNDDDQWEAVKKGERAHFSIHGKGKRKEVSKSEEA